MPNSLVSIGSGAFGGCYALTTLKIPTGIKVLESSVFANCHGLTSVTIPDGVTTIREGAFGNCHKLNLVSIPPSVKTIEGRAFERCEKLTELYIDDLEAWLKIDMQSGGHPFGGSYSHDVKPIMYLKNEKIVDVVIPDTIEHIPNYAFYRASSLRNVYVPASVKSLGGHPFDHSDNVCVKFESEIPPTIDVTWTFYRFCGSIYVPQASVELYRVQPGWQPSWQSVPIIGY